MINSVAFFCPFHQPKGFPRRATENLFHTIKDAERSTTKGQHMAELEDNPLAGALAFMGHSTAYDRRRFFYFTQIYGSSMCHLKLSPPLLPTHR